MLYIGIDLGTSACKLLLVDEKRLCAEYRFQRISALLPTSGLERARPQGLVDGVPGGRAGAVGRL